MDRGTWPMGSHRVGHDWCNLACRQHHLWPRMREELWRRLVMGRWPRKILMWALNAVVVVLTKGGKFAHAQGIHSGKTRHVKMETDWNSAAKAEQCQGLLATTGSANWKKNAQPKSWELCFIWWTKLRTEVQNTASQIALRDCSEEVREVPA